MKGEGNYTGKGHLIIVNVPSYAETTELLRELDYSPDFKDIPRVIVTAHLPNRDKELPDFLVRKIDAFIMGLPSALETLQRVNASQAKACVLTSSASDPAMDDTNTLTAGLLEKNWPQIVTVMTCSRAETLNNLNTFGIDGGISTPEQAFAKILAGACAVQLYTALVYKGIGLAADINHGLDALLAQNGFANIAEAVGTDKETYL